MYDDGYDIIIESSPLHQTIQFHFSAGCVTRRHGPSISLPYWQNNIHREEVNFMCINVFSLHNPTGIRSTSMLVSDPLSHDILCMNSGGGGTWNKNSSRTITNILFYFFFLNDPEIPITNVVLTNIRIEHPPRNSGDKPKISNCRRCSLTLMNDVIGWRLKKDSFWVFIELCRQ